MAAACCWPPQRDRIRAALDADVDWRNFEAVVAKHRVAGLVAKTMFSPRLEGVPEAAEAAVCQRARRFAIESAVLTREAAVLSLRLEHLGVPAYVLKGATVGALAYGDAALRHTRDIDLLVAPEDVIAAHAAITAAGYRVHGGEMAEPQAIERFMRESKHLAYSQISTHIQLELHWRLYDNAFFSDIPAYLARSRQVDVGYGVRLRALAFDELLAYLCGHGGLHGWFRLKWLADVASLFRADPEALENLLAQAKGQPLYGSVVQALVLSHGLFGIPLPKNAIKISTRDRWLIRIAWDAMTRGNASMEPQAERFALLKTRLSAFLLSFRFGYLISQIKVELMADDPGPSHLTRSRWKAPWRKILLWLVTKMIFPRRRSLSTQPPQP